MGKFLKNGLKLLALAIVAILVMRLLFPLPDLEGREQSSFYPASTETRLGAAMLAAQAIHPEKTGVRGLADGTDALSSRLALAEAAEVSIDAQYYIWHDDTAGILLIDALHRAAERGVRVRLLLDDNGIPGLDSLLATLNQHENMEIRLFNPSTIRRPKYLGYTYDFMRMNRRMHNKSFIVDGAAAIIGGRNIGDEYFQIKDEYYVDMDVLAIGGIVQETSEVFDDYWNSQSVFEFETIVSGTGDMDAYKNRVEEINSGELALKFMETHNSSAAGFAKGNIKLEWADVKLVADDPVKGLGIATDDQLMISRLGEVLGSITERLDLVSAYFIPGKAGNAWFSKIAKSGVEVNILTNALDTTDVLLVHAGYTKYRRELLEAGVHLFEMKLRGESTEAGLQNMPFGLSGAALHAKTFAVDGKRIFIGSFNFDPRSATLNCEMGFLIESERMARRVSAAFDAEVQTVSYIPELTPEQKMIWREPVKDGNSVVYQEEPGATWFQQIAMVVIAFLPIEWML